MNVRHVLDSSRSQLNRSHPELNPGEGTWSNLGYCTTCTSEVTFIAKHAWLRDHYVCSNCGSIPRERALMQVLDTWYPDWPQLRIHESSPGKRGASIRLARECRSYIPSQFFPDVPLGQSKDQMRCENLEALSFPDESLDLQISQDVMEHVLNPERAFREIARALKPGGAHIFTVPLVRKHLDTVTRARRCPDGSLEHRLEPQYHGNPISDKGSLVATDWGYDICDFIHRVSGLTTTMIVIDDLSKGIRAEYIEVLVSRKAVITCSSSVAAS